MEPYTRREAELDRDWAAASQEQRTWAFDVLLGTAIANAQLGDKESARVLRMIRARRDGTGQPAEAPPVCAWCSLPAGHTGDHAPLGQVEPTAPGVL